MTPSSCKRQLAEVGLRVHFERDVTIGWEWVVYDRSDRAVAMGWHEGTRAEAAAALMSDHRVTRAIAVGRATEVLP